MKGYNFEGKSPNLLPLGENGLRTKVCPSNLQRWIEPSPAPVPIKIIFGFKQFAYFLIKNIKTRESLYNFQNNLKLDELSKFNNLSRINLLSGKKHLANLYEVYYTIEKMKQTYNATSAHQ